MTTEWDFLNMASCYAEKLAEVTATGNKELLYEVEEQGEKLKKAMQANDVSVIASGDCVVELTDHGFLKVFTDAGRSREKSL